MMKPVRLLTFLLVNEKVTNYCGSSPNRIATLRVDDQEVSMLDCPCARTPRLLSGSPRANESYKMIRNKLLTNIVAGVLMSTGAMLHAAQE